MTNKFIVKIPHDETIYFKIHTNPNLQSNYNIRIVYSKELILREKNIQISQEKNAISPIYYEKINSPIKQKKDEKMPYMAIYIESENNFEIIELPKFLQPSKYYYKSSVFFIRNSKINTPDLVFEATWWNKKKKFNTEKYIRYIKNMEEDEILDIPHITAIDVDYKNNEAIGILIFFHPRGKKPEIKTISTPLQDIPVRLIEGIFEYQAAKSGDEITPLSEINESGTLGLLVIDNVTEQKYWLSAAHVMFRDRYVDIHTHIMFLPEQPQGLSVSGEIESINVLKGYFGRYALSCIREIGIDCAISTANDNSIATINGKEIEGLKRGRRNMKVWKLGMNGKTNGTIASDLLSFNGYGHHVIEPEYRFKRQIRILSESFFSKEGDSGSAVISTNDNHVVGLLIGKILSQEECSIATPIQPIFNLFNIRLV